MRPRRCARLRQFVSLGEGGSQRLFDKHVDSSFHKRESGLKMGDCGNRDGGSPHFTMSGGELLNGSEGAAAKFAGDGIGAL